MHKLDKLRQKTKQERQRIALTIAFVITLTIAAVWLSVMLLSFDASGEGVSQTEGPIQSFIENISRALGR